MGSILSRASGGRGGGGSGLGPGGDESESGGGGSGGERAYRYPPKLGAPYFSNHFIMGEEKFESPQPESFLFGENSDLNFLSHKPLPFPYPPPQSSEPTKTLKSLVNIRRDSLRFLKNDDGKYGMEFIFDSDVKCSITIHHFASEELPSGTSGVTYSSRFKSETYHYKRGAAQRFSQPSYVFTPDNFSEEELSMVNPDLGINFECLPIVIHALSEEGEDPKQSHSTIGIVEKAPDGSYLLKAVKQKIFVDGLSYLLQEIYGLENKMSSVSDKSNNSDEDEEEGEDCGSECVVCMCDLRDTIILPCRHLCLCNACADSLRYQANNCPICRSPFRALLQIRALQKVSASHPAMAAGANEDGVPSGYVSISLVEALNGPILSSPAPPPVLLGGGKTSSSKKNSSNGVKKTSSAGKGSKSPVVEVPPPSLPEDEEDFDEEEEPHEMIPLQTPEVKSISMHIVNETSSIQTTADHETSSSSEEEDDDLVEEELAKMDDGTNEDDNGGESVVVGSPTSGRSAHSSQESSSASSTKRLLSVVTPEAATRVVNVLPQDGEEDGVGEEEETEDNDDEGQQSKLYL